MDKYKRARDEWGAKYGDSLYCDNSKQLTFGSGVSNAVITCDASPAQTFTLNGVQK